MGKIWALDVVVSAEAFVTSATLFIVFPLRYFYPVDSETAAGTLVIDYIDDEPFLPEQPGKPP